LATATVLAALGLALAWLLFSGRDSAPETTARRGVNEEINHAELEQAEREVREADDADSVRDWGPGATPPPVA
jgi:hypothetical protein